MKQEGLFEVALKLFVRKGDELLVLIAANTKQGDFPGGRMDMTDSLFERENSLRREITEELGGSVSLKVSREPCFIFPYTSKNNTQEVLGLAHVANYEGGEIILSEEHIKMLWLPVEEAVKHYEGDFLKGIEKYLTFDRLPLGENPISI